MPSNGAETTLDTRQTRRHISKPRTDDLEHAIASLLDVLNLTTFSRASVPLRPIIYHVGACLAYHMLSRSYAKQ